MPKRRKSRCGDGEFYLDQTDAHALGGGPCSDGSVATGLSVGLDVSARELRQIRKKKEPSVCHETTHPITWDVRFPKRKSPLRRLQRQNGPACLFWACTASGTSALTRVMSLLGAALPKHIVPPHSSNETGHWEPELLMRLNEQLLAEVDPRPNP